MNKLGLVWIGPQGEEGEPLDGAVTIGSAPDATIRVKDAAPRHAVIRRAPEGYVLRDLTGQRLIAVNGRRVEQHLLREGDLFRIGSVEFRTVVCKEPERVEPHPSVAPAPLRRPPSPRRPEAPARPGWRRPVFAAASIVSGIVGVLLILLSSRQDASIPPEAPRPVLKVTPRSFPPDSSTSAPPPAPAPLVEAPSFRGSEETAPAPLAEVPDVRPLPRSLFPRERSESDAPLPMESPRPAPGPSSEALCWVRNWNRPEHVSLQDEAAALRSSSFAVRYAALLVRLHRAFSEGTGYEAAYRALLEASPQGGPPSAREHVRALAESLKEAVYCTDCTGGRRTCPDCSGKGRRDRNCPVCEGRGRVRASGAVGNADVTVKCRNCEGLKIFRDVTCETCSRSGSILCPSCRGSPWREARCYADECRNGRIPCRSCRGRGWVSVPCPHCVNGRVRPSGAVGDADVTTKCRTCSIDGYQGNGTLRKNCPDCRRNGWTTCPECGGAFSKRRGGFRGVPLSRVFTAEPCRCPTASGPQAPDLCPRCLGLGVRLRPAKDPSKTLD
ncbi:MAG TPA: FHA domain-containing protein [Planctomycetota bacterium]|nr:FHA domain-containing protein [Planctomycetota bacterium]